MSEVIGMVRPTWSRREEFLAEWKAKDITVLINQRKTKDVTRLCVESLLRWYPDIPILILDGDSQDDSTLYLKWKEVTNPNITVRNYACNEGSKHTSHGSMMHSAICAMINTKYVLLLDSDTITERGGWIEKMLAQIKDEFRYLTTEERNSGKYNHPLIHAPIYAVGSLMLPGRKGEAIKPPQDETDVLRYAHPSCSIIDREKYLEIAKTFTHWPDGQVIPNIASDHGSPLVWNMMGAADLGYRVEYFPVDKYVSHLSGASWCEPQTIWPDDHDVCYRPFVTFLAYFDNNIQAQTESSYETIILPIKASAFNVVIHGNEPIKSSNNFYELRFDVHGEYICVIEKLKIINANFVEFYMWKAIELNAPDEFEMDGLKFVSRRTWQKRECLSM